MKTVQMPYSKLAKALGVKDVFLKREDQHKYGSHKGRAIPLMIKHYLKEEEITNFVISSSGNAALAAIHATQSHNRNNLNKIKLSVLVGENIIPQKLKIIIATINDINITLEQVEKPKQTAFQIDKDGKAKNLRQSTDEIALLGYFELAQELGNIPHLSAVFVPTSSGTTAQGIGEAFEKLEMNPQVHIVQTEASHPIAGDFHPSEKEKDSSIAGAIVDRVAHRKAKVVEVIKNSQGSGWIVSDEGIKEAVKLVKETCNVAISANSALSVAGLKKAREDGWTTDGVVACLITGA